MIAENVERFDGLAETYALHRPDYPVGAFRDLLSACGSDRMLAVDVGAGPGTSTRPLRAALPEGWLITAVEPGRDMRRVLARSLRDEPRVQVADGLAEALPLPDGSAGLIVACTAVHWFDRRAFLAEARRVLAPGGVLAVLRNRRAASPLIGALNLWVSETSRGIGDFPAVTAGMEPSVRELSALPGFKTARSRTYRWREVRDARALVDLYLTRAVVWTLVRRIGLGPVMAELTAICEAHLGAGDSATAASLDWETTVKWTQRR